MILPEQKRERVAGWVLGGWLLFHQFLLPDAGVLTLVVVLLLIGGVLLRTFGIFPPALVEWLLLAGAGLVALSDAKSGVVVLGTLSGLFGAVLLLRPLSPRRGLWVLLCAVAVLASITLQESDVVNTVFVILDVAVLMFVAQHIHAPAEADVALWESVFRSLRLVLPVALIVSLVFWLFPAISEHTNIAFVRFAGGDLLSPGDVSEIHLTRRIAFVATFSNSSAVPGFSELYWRGQVLEKNDGLRWAVDPARINLGSTPGSSSPDVGKWRYSQTLGPDRALAALDRPLGVVASTHGQMATVLETGPSAFSVLGTGDVGLEIVSTPFPPDDAPLQAVASGSLEVPNKIRHDPRLNALALRLAQPGATLPETLESLGHFLAVGGYSYTLSPGKMAAGDVSWFLFQHRKGFCGHYAAAAANLLRMGGIPSRIVTGYRGGTWNPWLRTLTLRDSDAHAWVEAWDENVRQWTRFDPTSFIAPELTAMLERERDPDRWPWIRFAATYAATVLVQTGRGLGAALSHHSPPVSWTAVVVIAGMFAAIWRISSRRKSKLDIAASCLAKLERQSGQPRHAGETPLAWLARLESLSPSGSGVISLKTFSASYELLVYSSGEASAEITNDLKCASQNLIKIWKKGRSASAG